MRFIEFKEITKQPLFEAEARIQHAEDVVFWEGSAGAARTLEALRGLELGGHENVTIKWDGKPAIIFGRNENGEFILTDKSGFGAKGYNGRAKSAQELADMLLNRKTSRSLPVDADYAQFINNMKDIFDEYEKAMPKDYQGYFKGDLLYYNLPPVEDGKFTFTPNIVTYQITKNSEIGQRIARSKSGVVVHRVINENGDERPIDVDLNNFFQGDDVLVFPPVTVQQPAQIDETAIDKMKTVISRDGPLVDKLLDKPTLSSLKLTNFAEILYRYVNQTNLKTPFMSWLDRDTQISDVKKTRIQEHIQTNIKGFEALWQIVAGIQIVKNDIITQFDSHDSDVKAFIGSDQGGEGYVLDDPQGDIKLVNRSGFTAANRAVQR